MSQTLALAPTGPTSRDVPVQPRAEERSSRRALLASAGLAALGAMNLRRARAEPVGASADIDPNAILLKLVSRTTFGVNAAALARAQQLGYGPYIEEQLALTPADEDPALNAKLAAYSTLNMTPEQAYANNNSGQQRNELTEAAVLRAVMSKRQLYEKMVEFWTDHFSIDMNEEQAQFLKTMDDRDVIRAHALGTFPALLSASAHSACMLVYLNNDVNTKNGPNENYARELCELHTLGVGSGYTQADVQHAAKALTGWTRYSSSYVEPGTGSTAKRGLFRYIDSNHDKTQKTFLGHTLAANRGQQDGEDVLAYLWADPRTAAFVAKKMCRRFLGETCPQGHIDAVAATYMSTGGDIKSMLRTLLNPRLLWDSPPRYKRPFHLVTSALRALPVTITSLSGTRTSLSNCQHLPFNWGPPDGYPDTFDWWGGLALPRWNYAATLPPGSSGSVLVDTASFFSGLTTAAQIADKINTGLFGGAMAPADKARVQAYLGAGNPSTSLRNEAIGLALSAPSFQWY